MPGDFPIGLPRHHAKHVARLPKCGFQSCFIVSVLFAHLLIVQSTLQSADAMQALARGFREGGSSLLPRLLPVLGVTASSAGRITTTAAAPAAQAEAAAPSNDGLQREFLVYRWSPETGGKPRYDSYKVDINRSVNFPSRLRIALAPSACPVQAVAEALQMQGAALWNGISSCIGETAMFLIVLQLWSHDAGHPVQDQGREGPHPELPAVMQVCNLAAMSIPHMKCCAICSMYVLQQV